MSKINWIDIWAEIPFDKAKINTEISKNLWKKTLKNELNEIYNFLKWIKQSSEDKVNKDYVTSKYITIRNNTCIFYRSISEIREKVNRMIQSSENLIDYCYNISSSDNQRSNKDIYLQISLIETLEKLESTDNKIKSLWDLEEILLFLHKLWIIRVEWGLFMFRTKFNIKEWDNFDEQFTNENYQDLKDYYEKKIEQVHIMWEYVKRVQKRNDPNIFIDSYFNLDYKNFIDSYFKNRKWEIKRSMTVWLYDKLFWELSNDQKNIIESSWNSLIIAGPWAWKTKTIVHKVVSLILKEWIKKEEFLLLSFSRSAKFEIKKRIVELLGNEWYYLDIHTFHSFAFKILWREAKESDTKNIIKDANQYLKENDPMLPYSVIILDEFQDINDDQYEFVKLIKERSSKSEDMRIIATGDDDQNIYWFQWWNVKYIREFKKDYWATEYILTTNYRSNQEIIDISSNFISDCGDRIKAWKKLESSKNQNLFSNSSLIKAVSFKNNNYTIYVEEYLRTLLSKNSWKKIHLWILCYTNEKVLEIAYILKKAWYKNYEILLRKTWYKLDQTIEFIEFIEAFRWEDNIEESDIRSIYQKIIEKFWENKNTNKLWIAINNFLKVNRKIYFKSIEEYFVWMNEGDIIKEDTQIIISTLHKAKWKEFDSVLLIFDEERDWNKDVNNIEKMDELRRLIYVGLTRAKEDLIVLWNQQNIHFKKLYTIFDKKEDIDNEISKQDREIEIITWLNDINLWYNVSDYKNGTKDYINIWEHINIKPWAWYYDFIYNGTIIQRSSRKLHQTIEEKFINKWFKIDSVEIFQRVIYYLKDKWENIIIYLFLIHFKK